jgi:hypothetical protein
VIYILITTNLNVYVQKVDQSLSCMTCHKNVTKYELGMAKYMMMQ